MQIFQTIAFISFIKPTLVYPQRKKIKVRHLYEFLNFGQIPESLLPQYK